MPAIIRLPWSLQRRLEAAANQLLYPLDGRGISFSGPPGEQALVPPDSVSWRIFKNPVALFVGGVAAVILELAEPRVRKGVWEHSTFRRDPLGRLRRTGLAAMVTVYAAKSVSKPMISRVVKMHASVRGGTADQRYSANDPELLTWVQATAAFGFSEAYDRYVEPLSRSEVDAFYREGSAAARLYGAPTAPASLAEFHALADAMRERLEPSPIVFRFLHIMRETPAFPAALSWLQPLMVRAAVDMIPDWTRLRLGLTELYGLHRQERWLVKLAGALADRIMLEESPASQACMRLGLPLTYLYSGGVNPSH